MESAQNMFRNGGGQDNMREQAMKSYVANQQLKDEVKAKFNIYAKYLSQLIIKNNLLKDAEVKYYYEKLQGNEIIYFEDGEEMGGGEEEEEVKVPEIKVPEIKVPEEKVKVLEENKPTESQLQLITINNEPKVEKKEEIKTPRSTENRKSLFDLFILQQPSTPRKTIPIQSVHKDTYRNDMEKEDLGRIEGPEKIEEIKPEKKENPSFVKKLIETFENPIGKKTSVKVFNQTTFQQDFEMGMMPPVGKEEKGDSKPEDLNQKKTKKEKKVKNLIMKRKK